MHPVAAAHSPHGHVRICAPYTPVFHGISVFSQVSYLVYPGTSGAPYIDYLIADRHVSGTGRPESNAQDRVFR